MTRIKTSSKNNINKKYDLIKYDSYIIRYSEIALKGKNRSIFEDKLVQNIKKQLYIQNKKYDKVSRVFGRIIIDSKDNLDLKIIFGMSSYTKTIKIGYDFEEIKQNIIPFIEQMNSDDKIKSFRVTCQRLNKDYKKTSIEIEREIGEFIFKKTNKKVDLINPDYTFIIEIVRNNAYLGNEKINAFSGLPVGIEGDLFALIEDENSILASFLLMKRGCMIYPIAYEKKDISKLQKYSPEKLKLRIIKNVSELKDIQKEFKIQGIISGNTIDNYEKISEEYIQLSPLVFWSKTEIKELLKKI